MRNLIALALIALTLTACAGHDARAHAAADPTLDGSVVGAGQDAALPGNAGTNAAPSNLDAAIDAASADASAAGDGACDPGTRETAWAKDCPTTPADCVAGTWTDPGSTTNDPLQCESAHFAVHAPSGTLTQQQCNDATNTLETLIWPAYFGPPILFPEPYCNSATKHKASIVVHADYGLTGGGWGNGYMGMWIGPGATSDHWGLAHEFAHAVQSRTQGLDCGGPASNNFCGWIWESHANFMPHQLAEYRGDVHCSEMLVNAPHLYLGSTRDRYCNWQFMEFLKDKHCYGAVSDIWTATPKSNDPFSNIASTRGFSTAQLNDFFGEWAMHNVTWDYRNPDGSDQGAVYRAAYGRIDDTSKPERRLRLTRLLPLDAAAHRYASPPLQAPQRWGYNVVRLHPDPGATHVRVTFRGVTQPDADSDWRWGLVATDAALTTSRYSALQHGADAELDFCIDDGEPLFLVVTATPSVQKHIVWDELYPKLHRYPYMIELEGAEPDGLQPNAPNPSQSGMRWPNGGGWVDSNASVASGAFVGPNASVLSGSVGATARIEDSAIIDGANVMSGTVGGLTVLTSAFTVSGSASVRVSWPYAPGHFEKPQSASGSATLLGDLELRGVNTSKASGVYCGFADAATSNNCDVTDVTLAPPYVWRP